MRNEYFPLIFPLAGPIIFCLKSINFLEKLTPRDSREEFQRVHCELRVAVAVAQGQFGKPRRGTSSLEAGKIGLVMEQQTGKTQCVHSELRTVGISDSASP
jgi:hypothetical protein